MRWVGCVPQSCGPRRLWPSLSLWGGVLGIPAGIGGGWRVGWLLVCFGGFALDSAAGQRGLSAGGVPVVVGDDF